MFSGCIQVLRQSGAVTEPRRPANDLGAVLVAQMFDLALGHGGRRGGGEEGSAPGDVCERRRPEIGDHDPSITEGTLEMRDEVGAVLVPRAGPPAMVTRARSARKRRYGPR